MKEIKYRFWDTINQEMSDVALMIDGDGIIYEWDLYSMDSDGWNLYSMESDETNRYIPIRYTGLKDKNGKKIYEGDIVTNYAIRDVVIFDRGCFVTKNAMMPGFPNFRQPLCVHDDLKVIGNIYQNPDLLKE